jgi:uncharacterized membrane protein YfcA
MEGNGEEYSSEGVYYMGNGKRKWGSWLCGGLAGVVNGLFGAGGGMVLVPLLRRLTDLEEKEIFACSVGIILPLSLVTLGVYFLRGGDFASQSLPYLIGGALGGIGAGILLKKVKAKWLHKLLGIFILYGGFRLIVL